jgi:hypothetical protein
MLAYLCCGDVLWCRYQHQQPTGSISICQAERAVNCCSCSACSPAAHNAVNTRPASVFVPSCKLCMHRRLYPQIHVQTPLSCRRSSQKCGAHCPHTADVAAQHLSTRGCCTHAHAHAQILAVNGLGWLHGCETVRCLQRGSPSLRYHTIPSQVAPFRSHSCPMANPAAASRHGASQVTDVGQHRALHTQTQDFALSSTAVNRMLQHGRYLMLAYCCMMFFCVFGCSSNRCKLQSGPPLR